ncbi:MAG: phospho-sugar mutase [Deltaproteobacteria bacterium]|nr:phospho-sugar mutase [Deltaproteobacteria bacterium]MCW5805772.1 phospho-sugar mutase [Deltaproteobacteria bacterium]
MSYRFREEAQHWLAEDPDPVTAGELRNLLAACDDGGESARRELVERFDGTLEFGTAGLRGILGAGPQRMNRVLVRKVSAGLGAYLLANVPDAKRTGVLIGHDARRNSRVFAEDTARVLGGLGIRVYLAHRPWPTPTTAWAVVDKQACAGVMVTASHNPPAYNGYKVYWSNGAQIIPPHDTGIAAAIAKIGRSDQLAMPELEALRRDGLVIDLDETLHDVYLQRVVELRAQPDLDGRSLVIAYTPLHGVGALSVEGALARGGFPQFHTETSQREPDPEFPTVAFPNPEEKGAMDRVLALAAEVKADLVLANDPDADRLCVAVPEGAGYRLLTGDQVGVLLADYLLEVGPRDKRMVATTIVSSQLLGFLAQQAGADYRETLTGFKWIGNAAMQYEREHHGRFVVGYEEALGYSVGPLVRDKDGVSAALIFAELAMWNRARGKTVLDHLDDIYRRVGLFVTEQVSLTKPGSEGLAEIRAAMARFRSAPPKELAGHAIESIADLAKGEGGLPPSDVLVYRLAGGRRVIMRPSGTEPKLKSYYEVRVEVRAGEPISDTRARGLAELARLRDAHQALLA